MPFVPVARVGEIRPRYAKRVEFGPDAIPFAIAIFNLGDTYYAIEDRCTHVDYPLSEGDVCGEDVICPLHGACFNLRTGQPSCGPCNGPVKTYPIRVTGDRIEVDLTASGAAEPLPRPEN